jgi:hydroxyethylthiazole kinase
MNELKDILARVKAESPLTLSITNQVTIGDCANALLAIGAAPVMSGDPDDARDLAALASATVLNIGTVGTAQLEILLAAGQGARASGRPVVLDPVGAGATAVRRAAAEKLMREADIIRGNWSEIQALAGWGGIQRGVDSAAGDDLSAVAALAEELAGRLGVVVAVTGATDVVAGRGQMWFIGGGSPLLTRLTGTGCLLSAMVGAYAGAAGGDLALAAAGALTHLALAGQRAAESLGQAPLLGTFKTRLFDSLALVSPEDLGRSGLAARK